MYVVNALPHMCRTQMYKGPNKCGGVVCLRSDVGAKHHHTALVK